MSNVNDQATPAPLATPLIAVVPDSAPVMHRALVDAVIGAGARVATPDEYHRADAMVWADPAGAAVFPTWIAQMPQVRWVQLPYAGIENFARYLDHDRVWTCGKGVYAEPVAEHVLALALAGFRNVHAYAKADHWGTKVGRNLLGARVTILGAGGITDSLLRLLAPFGCHTTVVRRQASPVAGATRTIAAADLDDALPDTDLLVVAWALTAETRGRVNASTFDLLPDHAWVINVGRGRHIVTSDLVEALASGAIGGAALDVTDPEPLPNDHPLWSMPNCIITPHVGNTPDMGRPLLAARVGDNVRRFVADPANLGALIGLVDVHAGY